ncbi:MULTISPECIES: hypothetical protein [unclassified Halomonas]|uniref:hypothetical protein n=1 Tax=unclassified Halomonas TaxID=2609666 RepID=UPI001C950D70|nr:MULTISPECIES: hypothetical protein [unclassified Halomonas]MBY5926084.1 hypothetical protein [Halomonas sp. DP4Y7-2]MBY6233126.1 hypothetical protein [Halomonas sp. DP4Y7-1]
MRIKYKVGLFKLNIFAAAGLLAACALLSDQPWDGILLSLAALWFALTGLALEFSHRRHAYRPWLAVASLLLAALVMLPGHTNAAWLWAWPCLLALPQPRWMQLLNACLAGLSWWSLIDRLSPHHWILVGLLLTCLCLYAISRSLPGGHSQRLVRKRARLAPGLALWSAEQLERDLVKENSRAARDDVHAELLLIHVQGRQLWRIAQEVCSQIKSFENAYQLDQRTLGVLLTSRDADQARQRRQELLDAINAPSQSRAVPLTRLDNLPRILETLGQQRPSPQVVEKAHD